MVLIIEMQGEPAVAEAGVILPQSEVRSVFSRGSCPWISGPWRRCAAQASGGVWVVTCACTQDSWWQRRQR